MVTWLRREGLSLLGLGHYRDCGRQGSSWFCGVFLVFYFLARCGWWAREYAFGGVGGQGGARSIRVLGGGVRAGWRW